MTDKQVGEEKNQLAVPKTRTTETNKLNAVSHDTEIETRYLDHEGIRQTTILPVQVMFKPHARTRFPVKYVLLKYTPRPDDSREKWTDS